MRITKTQQLDTDYEFFRAEIQHCLDKIEHYAALEQYGSVCFWQERQMFWEDNAQKYIDIVGGWL